MSIEEKIQQHLKMLEENLTTLRGQKATLEQQLRDTDVQINAIVGAIQVSRTYLEPEQSAESPVGAINEAEIAEEMVHLES